jgi:hypothetical protein
LNRRLSLTVATGIIALTALAACGGGGGSSPTPPTVTPVPTTMPVPIPVPTAVNGGFVVATTPVTILGGAGGAFGSTVTNASNTAVFAAQSAATPDSVSGSAGATLPTSTVTMTESGGQATQSRLRATQTSPRIVRDADTMRRPDLMGVERMRSIAQDLRRAGTVARSAQSTRAIAATPQNFAPGAAFTFQLQCSNISGTTSTTCTNGLVAAPAHLITQMTHANIWLDDKDANATEYPTGVKADMDKIGALFEQNYAVETAAFGPAYTNGATVQFQECDASGTPLTGLPDPGTDTTGKTDPQINIIITNALAGTGEGGYFFGADMLSQSEANCIKKQKVTVNNLKMIVMSSDVNTISPGFPANNETFYLQETAPQTMAHEYQHYLHYINKFLQQIVVDPNNPSAGTVDDSFVDEGCSVLAQDLVVAPNGRDPKEAEAPLFVRAYLLEPDLFSLTSFSGYQPDPASSSASAPYGYYHNNAGNYGFSYLLMRYLYDRFGGTSALRAIYAEKSNGLSGVDVGPVVAAANGEPFAQVYQEFATALAVHIGGGATEVTTDPHYAFSSQVVLRGLVQTYSRRTATNIRNIVQPGPLNPEVFNGSTPTLDATGQNTVRQSLTPGQTITLKLISGATVFVTPTGTPSTGATVRASDITPSFQGSLSQGPLPTPTPAFY